MLDNFYIYSDFPCSVFAEPNQVSFAIGHLTRDADLVEVEVGSRPKRIRFPLRDRLKIGNYLRALQTYSLL